MKSDEVIIMTPYTKFEPIFGCKGCATTGGRIACQEHGYKKDNYKLRQKYSV